jgi:FKBP-type peptidyl-prolyl cis-trans isomerase
MRERMHRFIWLFLAILFVVTALGVGVYAFWTNTHNTNQNSYIACATGAKVPNQQPSNGKVRGTKLAAFTPLGSKHIDYLSCTDFKVGTGTQITADNQTVSVKYVGALAATGDIFDDSFDDSNGQPFSTQLTQVITGWSTGLLGMKAGGIRRLEIPAKYAYGSQAVSNIPANSDLVFDVQLVSVK